MPKFCRKMGSKLEFNPSTAPQNVLRPRWNNEGRLKNVMVYNLGHRARSINVVTGLGFKGKDPARDAGTDRGPSRHLKCLKTSKERCLSHFDIKFSLLMHNPCQWQSCFKIAKGLVVARAL